MFAYWKHTPRIKKVPTDVQNICTAGKRIKFAIKPIQHYPSHLRHVATLLWIIKSQFFADISQIWKKMQTNFDIYGFKTASFSPYWLQVKFSMSLFFHLLVLQSICGSRNSSLQTPLQCLSTIDVVFSDEVYSKEVDRQIFLEKLDKAWC